MVKEMYTIIGGVMIFAACSAVGFSAARMYRLRVGQLEAFLRLISHIRAQIDCFCAPLDSILDGYESPELSACGFLFAARELGADRGFDICRRRLLLTEDEADELSRFFDGLGHHSAGEESSHCAYYEKTLGDALAHERSELARRTKLCRTFGMLAGFLLAVLLI